MKADKPQFSRIGPCTVVLNKYTNEWCYDIGPGRWQVKKSPQFMSSVLYRVRLEWTGAWGAVKGTRTQSIRWLVGRAPCQHNHLCHKWGSLSQVSLLLSFTWVNISLLTWTQSYIHDTGWSPGPRRWIQSHGLGKKGYELSQFRW